MKTKDEIEERIQMLRTNMKLTDIPAQAHNNIMWQGKALCWVLGLDWDKEE